MYKKYTDGIQGINNYPTRLQARWASEYSKSSFAEEAEYPKLSILMIGKFNMIWDWFDYRRRTFVEEDVFPKYAITAREADNLTAAV